MRIVASVVVYNEEDRYLKAFLEWNRRFWDECFIYDGGSTDNTLRICAPYADGIQIKPDNVPSFIEHEAEYRKAAFRAMEESMSLTEDDWIISLDADEFLHGDIYDVRNLAMTAQDCEYTSAMIKIPEVWDTTGSSLQIRTDGFWNTMKLPRLFRYQEDWDTPKKTFRDKPMGCGSGPVYTYSNFLRNIQSVYILHFGYSQLKDREAKFLRYTSLKNHGHNEKHIRSIVQTPELMKWKGQIPKWYSR